MSRPGLSDDMRLVAWAAWRCSAYMDQKTEAAPTNAPSPMAIGKASTGADLGFAYITQVRMNDMSAPARLAPMSHPRLGMSDHVATATAATTHKSTPVMAAVPGTVMSCERAASRSRLPHALRGSKAESVRMGLPATSALMRCLPRVSLAPLPP